jgi:hypothetical protein
VKFLRWAILLLAWQTAFGQAAGFNYYVPAPGVQFNTGASPINSAATSVNVGNLWLGSGCTGAVAMLINGNCSIVGPGTVTSVAVTVPAPLTATGCSGTSVLTCAITWTGAQTANEFLATPDGTAGPVGLRAIVVGDIPTLNQNTSGNAATATALATSPAQCPGVEFATGITAAGVANCSTPPGGGNISNSGTPTNGQIAQWISSTQIEGITTVPIAAGGTGTASPAIVAGTNVTVSGSWPNQTINSTGGSGSGANPTGTVGLSAVNGSLTTFMRSDAAPPLSQSISPTMTGTWIWTDTTGGGITPASGFWAENFHLNDQQASGHSYGEIAGYCNGASPGTWGLYDYTAAASRICVGPLGNTTIEAPSSGTALTVNGGSGVAGYFYGGTALQVLDASTSYLLNIYSAANNSYISAYSASGQALVFQTSASGGGAATRMTIGADGGVTVGSPTGGSEGAGTVNATGLYINGGLVGTGGQTTGTFSLTASAGCTSGTATATGTYTKQGTIATVRITSTALCTSTASLMTFSGWPSSLEAAANYLQIPVIIAYATGQSGVIEIGTSTSVTIYPMSGAFSGFSGFVDSTSLTYPLN